MVIVGASGSGKSGAAILLVLAALRHREQVSEEDRRRVPVPGIFTVHGWNPNSQRIQNWLVSRLQQTYSMFAGKPGAALAAEMIRTGRITLCLDGLGAVALELQDIDASTAADYLTRIQLDPPPGGWRELTGLLRRAPDGPIARALSNPLTLTLIRDTYRSADDVRELLDFCDAVGPGVSREDFEDHLLDRVLLAAYSPRPGEPPPRYELPAAQRALSCLAVRMNRDGTRDLAWWRIPSWALAAPVS